MLPVDAESRKKQYRLTGLGKMILKEEHERLKELVRSGEQIMGGENDD